MDLKITFFIAGKFAVTRLPTDPGNKEVTVLRNVTKGPLKGFRHLIDKMLTIIPLPI